MKPLSRATLSMLCSYAGVFSLFFTLGIYLYWGNVSVYSNSYLRRKLGADPSIKSPWVISLISLGLTLGLAVSGYAARYIGRRGTMVLGCVLLDAGVFLTYFSVQRSVQAVNFSMGVLGGLGTGLVFGMGYVNVVSFEPKNLGLATATVEMAMSGGAAVINQLVTYYVNPDNLTPDLFDGRENYFDQEEVLDNVPSVFFVLGLFSLCFHVLGMSLIRAPKPREEEIQPCLQKEKCDSNHNGETARKVNDTEQNEPSSSPSSNGNSNQSKEEIATHTQAASTVAKNLSPKQMVQCRSFYIMWLSTGICDFSFIIMNNFYKSYGQTRISDDQFMANVSTFLLVSTMLSRPWWGVLIDKCGMKSALIYFSCFQCISSTFWYFTPMVSRWLYLFWSMLYSMSNCGLYVVVPICLIHLYGKAHFPENYGWVASSTILLNIVAPSIIHFVLARYGWFYLFFSSSCGNAAVVFLCIVALPRQ